MRPSIFFVTALLAALALTPAGFHATPTIDAPRTALHRRGFTSWWPFSPKGRASSYPVGTLLGTEKKWKVTGFAGAGHQGLVLDVVKNPGDAQHIYAAKLVRNPIMPGQQHALLHEYTIMTALYQNDDMKRHMLKPNDHFTNGWMDVLVMEKAPSTLMEEVSRHAKKLVGLARENMLRSLIWQTCNAFKILHGLGYAHGDIKPDNVLAAYRDIEGMPYLLPVIIDFGLAKISTEKPDRKPLRPRGSPGYLAPEKWPASPFKLESFKKADVFSFGILIFHVLTGKIPSRSRSPRTMFAAKIKWENFRTIISPSMLDLLQRMLRPDPENRLSMDEVWNHPTFEDVPSPSDLATYVAANRVVPLAGYPWYAWRRGALVQYANCDTSVPKYSWTGTPL